MMNLLLNTGNSTGLTGCPSALCVCRGCLTSWPCLRIQWLSLHILWLRLQTKLFQKSHISENKLPKVPWFNDDCKQAIKKRKKAQRKLFRNPTAENVLAFKQLKAKARHIIKTQKKTSWQSFCSSLLNLKLSGKQSEKSKGKNYLFFRSLKSQWKTYPRQETNCKSVSLF